MESNAACNDLFCAPYQDLYIYYLQGHLTCEESLRSDSYIGNWEEDGFSFLFFSCPAEQQVQKLLSIQSHLILLDKYQMSYQEWQGGPLETFRMGRFTIVPPWSSDDTLLDRDTIILDPGVVFGTGTHPTTRDCMAALEMAFYEHPNAVTLDIGTGTGLLAIAAAKLGSPQVVAADLNHLAARTALSNVRRNGLEDQILVIRGDAEKCIDLSKDLVVSNIHYDVMKHLINSKGFLNNRQFILSGLLRSQAREITLQLAKYPVKMIKQWAYDGVWHTFYGEITA